MKIQIVSDLHREVGIGDIPIVGDILILAGDITSSVFSNMLALREWLTSLGIPVYYVLGNHEYYRGDVDTTKQAFKDLFEDTNVTILDRDIVIFQQEDLILIGATLWTDIPIVNEFDVKRGMNDFYIISGMTLSWWANEFKKDKSYIEYMLKEYEDFTNKIVITHHLPSELSVPERFKGNSINAGFVTDLSDMILDREPTIWVHGHTHDSCDYSLGKTKVLCNPYGYKNYETNPSFKKDFIVEI